MKTINFVKKNLNMALTIELPSNIEEKLLLGANKKGVSIENYLLHLLNLATNLQKKQVKNKVLSEAELLQKVNLDITEAEWTEYRRLIVIRRAEKLTETEYYELARLGEKIEQANVDRLKYLVALAKLRKVSLEQLMDNLGIIPVEV
jgi:hypothetical protein